MTSALLRCSSRISAGVLAPAFIDDLPNGGTGTAGDEGCKRCRSSDGVWRTCLPQSITSMSRPPSPCNSITVATATIDIGRDLFHSSWAAVPVSFGLFASSVATRRLIRRSGTVFPSAGQSQGSKGDAMVWNGASVVGNETKSYSGLSGGRKRVGSGGRMMMAPTVCASCRWTCLPSDGVGGRVATGCSKVSTISRGQKCGHTQLRGTTTDAVSGSVPALHGLGDVVARRDCIRWHQQEDWDAFCIPRQNALFCLNRFRVHQPRRRGSNAGGVLRDGGSAGAQRHGSLKRSNGGGDRMAITSARYYAIAGREVEEVREERTMPLESNGEAQVVVKRKRSGRRRKSRMKDIDDNEVLLSGRQGNARTEEGGTMGEGSGSQATDREEAAVKQQMEMGENGPAVSQSENEVIQMETGGRRPKDRSLIQKEGSSGGIEATEEEEGRSSEQDMESPSIREGRRDVQGESLPLSPSPKGQRGRKKAQGHTEDCVAAGSLGLGSPDLGLYASSLGEGGGTENVSGEKKRKRSRRRKKSSSVVLQEACGSDEVVPGTDLGERNRTTEGESSQILQEMPSRHAGKMKVRRRKGRPRKLDALRELSGEIGMEGDSVQWLLNRQSESKGMIERPKDTKEGAVELEGEEHEEEGLSLTVENSRWRGRSGKASEIRQPGEQEGCAAIGGADTNAEGDKFLVEAKEQHHDGESPGTQRRHGRRRSARLEEKEKVDVVIEEQGHTGRVEVPSEMASDDSMWRREQTEQEMGQGKADVVSTIDNSPDALTKVETGKGKVQRVRKRRSRDGARKREREAGEGLEKNPAVDVDDEVRTGIASDGRRAMLLHRENKSRGRSKEIDEELNGVALDVEQGKSKRKGRSRSKENDELSRVTLDGGKKESQGAREEDTDADASTGEMPEVVRSDVPEVGAGSGEKQMQDGVPMEEMAAQEKKSGRRRRGRQRRHEKLFPTFQEPFEESLTPLAVKQKVGGRKGGAAEGEERAGRGAAGGETGHAQNGSVKVRWILHGPSTSMINKSIYLSGKAAALGDWDPLAALQMGEVQDGVWLAEAQMPREAVLEYSYFVSLQDRSAARDSFHLAISWRGGPNLTVRTPGLKELPRGAVHVEDGWEVNGRKNPQHAGASYGMTSRIFCLPESENSTCDADVENCTTIDADDIKDDGIRNRSTRRRPAKVRSFQEEHDVKRASILSLPKKQDEEEMLVAAPEAAVKEEEATRTNGEFLLVHSEVTGDQGIQEPGNDTQRVPKAVEISRLGGKKNVIWAVEEVAPVKPEKKPATKTEILINTATSTMPRVAILEDGELVELVVELVSKAATLGSVYLGIIRRLVPGMTAVFVDLGYGQLGLLDIRSNHTPITFPPLTALQGVDKENEDDDDDDDDGDNDEDEEEEVVDVVGEVVGEMIRETNTQGPSIIDYYGNGGNDMDKGVKNRGMADDASEDAMSAENGEEDLNEEESDDDEEGDLEGEPFMLLGEAWKRWSGLREGMAILVQVKKEALGKKGPRLTAFPTLAGRYMVLVPCGGMVGVSQKISGQERARLKSIAKRLRPAGFSLIVRTEACDHGEDELEKDVAKLMETWREILVEAATAAAAAAVTSTNATLPTILHRAMGPTVAVVRDMFTDKVERMVVDSESSYQEALVQLEEWAPHLAEKLELYQCREPIFDHFGIEDQIKNFSHKRVELPTGGYLVIEQTEALTSIDVNGGACVLRQNLPDREQAIVHINIEAAHQIAKELRLRDIGGIIVIDFIDMDDPRHGRLVYEEVKRAFLRDRSKVQITQISPFGVMEITRKRVRPSVTHSLSESCPTCWGHGRIESLEAVMARIERALRRLLMKGQEMTKEEVRNVKKWKKFTLRVSPAMSKYVLAKKGKRLGQLCASVKASVHIQPSSELDRVSFQVLKGHLSSKNGTIILEEGNPIRPRADTSRLNLKKFSIPRSS